MNVFTKFVSYSLYGLLLLCKFLITTSADEYEPMFRSLKSFQVHACEGNELKIQCPQMTAISIRYVRYGRPAGHSAICDRPSLTSSPSQEESREAAESCSSQEAVKVITKTCHEQSECRILVSAITFKDNPCPKVKKYAEVVYKCHPKVFTNRIICEGLTLNLRCGPTQRILIFSASYGNFITEPTQCSQVEHREEKRCESSTATETAISICTGKENCTLTASTEMFGKTSCSFNNAEHLKVAYTCVPTDVLRPVSNQLMTIGRNMPDGHVIHTTSYPAWAVDIDFDFPPYSENEDIPSSGEMQQDSRVASNRTEAHDRRVVGFLQVIVSAQSFVTKNRQKLVLYLTLSLGVGFTFFALVVFLHHYLTGAFLQDKEKLDVPPITEDFFSESDLENYEGDSSSHSPDINTMSRKISEAIPRAPISNGPETNHFFS